MTTIDYSAEPLLHVEGLKQYFKISRTYTTKAVDGISFDIYQGETYGLVGESGSGKSTTGRAIIRLYDPTDGKIIFDGHDISKKLSKEDEAYLRQNMQMIFQDPMACLNPRKKVKEIIAQGLEIHHLYSSAEELDEKVNRILDKVGLSREHATRYPQQFSGGQRQRIGIARALVMNPKLVIADEAISALDVSIQAQVVNLMKDLQDVTDVDLVNVNVLSIAAIFVIILIIFKSISLPVILVAVIEFAIMINMAIPYYQGVSLPFVASIVIGAIQLGVTVDYAILMTTRYQKERQNGKDKMEAISIAHKTSMPSIISSGLSFFAATFGVSLYSQVEMIGAICTLLARGAIISMIVVIMILPAMFMIFDKVICKTSIGFLKKKA